MLNLECASFRDLALSSGRFGQHVLAVVAGDDGLGMAEDDVGFVAPAAPDVHEVGVGSGDESFEFVGLALLLLGGVEEVPVHLWWVFID